MAQLAGAIGAPGPDAAQAVQRQHMAVAGRQRRHGRQRGQAARRRRQRLGGAAQLPLRSAAQYDRMDKWQRFILANARYAPKVLPFLVQAGFSLARKLGKEKFFAQVNGGSAADMATFADPAVREAVMAGSEVCLGEKLSAHEAFTRECISSERDWSALIHAAPGPVLLLQGDQDPQTPVQTIRELMGDYPELQIEFLPQTGQLLFFKEWRLALDRLTSLLPS